MNSFGIISLDFSEQGRLTVTAFTAPWAGPRAAR